MAPTAGRRNKGNKEQVYAGLRSRIVSGELPAGAPLSEREIALQYGLSRTPIREILHRLQSSGLVQIYPYRGAFVCQPDPRMLVDIFEAREAIEPHAAGLAALGCDAAELAAIRGRLMRLRITADPATMAAGVAIGSDLHDAIFRWADNPLLSEFYGQLKDRASLVRGLTRRRQDIEEASRKAHLAICKALARRDRNGAETAMRAHLRQTKVKLLP